MCSSEEGGREVDELEEIAELLADALFSYLKSGEERREHGN